jgi:ABC-type glycerol-3-phosphate transport system substrate-binding protein
MSRRRFVLASSAGIATAGGIGGSAAAELGAPSSRYTMPAVVGQEKITLTWAVPGNTEEVAVYQSLADEYWRATRISS